MSFDEDVNSLSKQQREIAAELSESPQTFGQIYDRVERDSCNGRPKAPRWMILVDLGIAEVVVDKYGKVCGLKRGKRWQDFWSLQGEAITKNQIQCLEIKRIVENVFGDLDLREH